MSGFDIPILYATRGVPVILVAIETRGNNLEDSPLRLENVNKCVHICPLEKRTGACHSGLYLEQPCSRFGPGESCRHLTKPSPSSFRRSSPTCISADACAAGTPNTFPTLPSTTAMQSTEADQSTAKPSLHSSKSFSRLEPTPRNSPLNRSRASTIDSLTYPTHRPEPYRSNTEVTEEETADIFARKEDDDDDDKSTTSVAKSTGDVEATSAGLETFEQLPIELQSLTHR
jgi:hypothetical protein